MQKSLPLCFEVTEVAFHIHLSTARIGREREFYIKIASIYFFFKRTNLKTPFFFWYRILPYKFIQASIYAIPFF